LADCPVRPAADPNSSSKPAIFSQDLNADPFLPRLILESRPRIASSPHDRYRPVTAKRINPIIWGISVALPENMF
jgi:hypothetical protein